MTQHTLELALYRRWFNTSKYFLETVTEDFEKYGLTVDHFRILELLYSEKGKYTIHQISEKLNIPSGSITYVINRLVKQEYIQKVPCPTDRRVTFVELTEYGEEVISEIVPNHFKNIANRTSSITDEEKHQLIELLDKLAICFNKNK